MNYETKKTKNQSLVGSNYDYKIISKNDYLIICKHIYQISNIYHQRLSI